MKHIKKMIILLLSFSLLLAFAACEWEPEEEPAPAEEITEDEPEVSETEQSWLSFGSYEELYAAIAEVFMGEDGLYYGSRATNEAVYDMEEDAAGGEGGGGDYSHTNLQVEAVDEADVVKTDGQYIYILRNEEVTVVKADGADTAEVNFIAVCQDTDNSYEYSSEMFLEGDVLSVLVNYYSWEENGAGQDRTILRCYDVSDPEGEISLLHELGQDGYYMDSRLIDGVLYLVSNYYVYSEPEEDDPITYVPALYDEAGRSSALAVEDIIICPGFPDVQYAVISAVDTASGERLAQQSVLGAGSTVYMNQDNLFLARGYYEDQESEPYTESVYQVVDHTDTSYTNIVRFDVSGGGLEMKAFAALEGVLSDQFALDEYEGYLRVALTANSSSYKIYTDEEYGFTNYSWEEDDDATDNRLYVLDGDLQVVGQLTGLAQDEWIRSVRFSGPVGYICTFEQIDPLFAIDLSDPTAPQVLSALKIPGFSQYLHPWGEDRLIGLGYAVDDEGFTMDQVKLSMFDCSDLTDVRETDVYVIEDLWYSAALYNHKAVTASVEKNLICFPGDGNYLIFAYDDEAGFQKLAQVTLDTDYWYDWNSRGLWVDDCFYVTSSSGVVVLDLADMSVLRELYFYGVG